MCLVRPLFKAMSLCVQLMVDHGKKPIVDRNSRIKGMPPTNIKVLTSERLCPFILKIAFDALVELAGRAGTHSRPPVPAGDSERANADF